MGKSLQLILMISAFLGSPPPLRAQPERGQELLDFVREAHRASRDAIQTCSCRVEYKGTIVPPGSKSPKEQLYTGRFWYSLDAVKAQVSNGGREREFLWKDSILEGVTHAALGEKKGMGAGRQRAAYRYQPPCDAWIRGRLVLNVPSTTENVPFEQLVERATRVTDVRRQSIQGKEAIVVRLFFAEQGERTAWNVEIHFDPSVNYLIRKTVYVHANGPYRIEDEVVSFKECSPGLFFPERLVGRSGPEGNYNFNHTTVISEIRINQPLPENVFHLRYPEGVVFDDRIRGVRYRANSEGKPISPEEPLEVGRVAVAPLGEEPASSRPMETQEEPRSMTRWILPISCGILAVGLIAAFVRRRHRSAAEG